jgi:hypothetical protein
MRSIWIGSFAMSFALLLSACGLYIHDPTLQENAEKSRTLVSEADLSAQVLQQIDGAQGLAKRHESAVLGFFIMKRNQQFLGLLQPDVLEAGAFGDGTGPQRAYVPKNGGFARDMADFEHDVKYAIDCRLDALLKTGDVVSECLLGENPSPTARSVKDYQALRIEARPELEFKGLRQLASVVESNRRAFLKELRTDGGPPDQRQDYSCEQAVADKEPIPLTSSRGVAYGSYVSGCENLLFALDAAILPFSGEKDSKIKAEPKSLLAQVAEQVRALETERSALEAGGAVLASELRAIESEIEKSAQPGKLSGALAARLEDFRKKLNLAHGISQLAGLQHLADLTDELLQIELSEGAQASSDGAAAGSGAAAADKPTEIEKKGEAILRVTAAAASAIDAYSGNAPNARAQSLIIARVALTQRIEVAGLQSGLIDRKLLLLRAQRRLFVSEVGHLANGGLYLLHEHLKSDAPKAALTHLAASWDDGRLEAQLVPYRILALERETSMRISATNAKHLQASVLAATDAIVAYSKGGITKEAIADIFAKLFIGGALLK